MEKKHILKPLDTQRENPGLEAFLLQTACNMRIYKI